jgi:TolA-binding protein
MKRNKKRMRTAADTSCESTRAKAPANAKVAFLLSGAVGFCIFTLVLSGGCSTVTEKELGTLGKTMLFQKAYEAADMGDYTSALKYYTAYRERFPDDLSGTLWASYEIGFIYHKMGDDALARKLFEDLLLRYKNEGTPAWPQAQRILAERVLKDMNEAETAKSAQQAEKSAQQAEK